MSHLYLGVRGNLWRFWRASAVNIKPSRPVGVSIDGGVSASSFFIFCHGPWPHSYYWSFYPVSGRPRFPMKIAHTKYSSWYFIMAHTLWGNSTFAFPVCRFEWQFVNVSILHRDHLIISSNMVVEEARILIRYLSPLSNATISSSRLFYVAPCARGTCDVSTVSFRDIQTETSSSFMIA